MGEFESRKTQDFLKAARKLFWKYGFKRVTVEEICEESAASKMTFYKVFSNKLELARAVFDKEVARAQNEFRSIMESDMTPAEKFNHLFRLKLEGTNDISSERKTGI
jgi:AcrR family transcriptional regulator